LTGIPITRTDEDLKSLSRKLTRYLVAIPLFAPVTNAVFMRVDAISP
jgi:hypothetical protein